MGAKKKATGRGRQLGLTRLQIIQAGIDYADANGTEKLSMRQLASTLGCGVMSLYNHVADKDDLIDGMVDQVANEIDLPTRKGTLKNWHADLRGCLISAYKMMLNHRWVAKYWSRGMGPAKNAYHETILRIMRQAGFSEELTCRGYHALTMHVVGFALQVIDLPFRNNTELRAMATQVLEELEAGPYPYLLEHAHFHLDGRDKRNDFKYMLDLILEGLHRDRLLDEG